jgi:CheY-like chemotaxis protein
MTSYSVLIVEDNVTLEGKQIKTWVEAAGFSVCKIARTRVEAVKLFEAHRPDIVLMDINLGTNDIRGGIEAARVIHSRDRKCKIIYVTGERLSREDMAAVASTSPVGFVKKIVREKDVLANLALAVAMLEDKHFIFVCYSHQNTEMMKEMDKYLCQLSHVGIEHWVDTRIRPGESWKQEIEYALQRAKAAIVLVSIEMMNSTFIREVELPSLLKSTRDLLVVPVFVNAVPQVVLERNGLLNFQGINAPDNPLDGWSETVRNRDAWVPLFNRLAERVK